MAGFLALHMRQGRRDSVQNPFNVNVNRPVPVLDLEPFERRMRHQAGVVEHDIDSSEPVHSRVDESLHLIGVVTSVATANASVP
jgi:hypothetical protein